MQAITKNQSTSSFFDEVYKATKKIPLGFVTTYGSIAEYLGTKDARKVGWALHANKDANVACHRVVNKTGRVATNYAFGGGRIQRERLEGEGVAFTSEDCVDMSKHFWDVR